MASPPLGPRGARGAPGTQAAEQVAARAASPAAAPPGLSACAIVTERRCRPGSQRRATRCPGVLQRLAASRCRGLFVVFFFGASSHGGVAAASSHVASLLSPCHSCNAAFPALQGLSVARTMSGCVCCLLACSLARGLHHIAVTALAVRMGPPGHCAQEFPLPAPLHGLTPNYLGS